VKGSSDFHRRNPAIPGLRRGRPDPPSVLNVVFPGAAAQIAGLRAGCPASAAVECAPAAALDAGLRDVSGAAARLTFSPVSGAAAAFAVDLHLPAAEAGGTAQGPLAVASHTGDRLRPAAFHAWRRLLLFLLRLLSCFLEHHYSCSGRGAPLRHDVARLSFPAAGQRKRQENRCRTEYHRTNAHNFLLFNFDSSAVLRPITGPYTNGEADAAGEDHHRPERRVPAKSPREDTPSDSKGKEFLNNPWPRAGAGGGEGTFTAKAQRAQRTAHG